MGGKPGGVWGNGQRTTQLGPVANTEPSEGPCLPLWWCFLRDTRCCPRLVTSSEQLMVYGVWLGVLQFTNRKAHPASGLSDAPCGKLRWV